MEKIKRIVRVMVVAVMIAIIPVSMPDLIPQTQISYIAKAKTLTKKQAKKKVVKYLKKKKIYKKKYILAYDSKHGKKYLFHYYEDMKTHTATINWYYVNMKTGKITAMFP